MSKQQIGGIVAMKKLYNIIEYLESKENHFDACATTSADYVEQDWTDLRPVYAAQAAAIKEIIAEIRAAIPTLPSEPPSSIVCWLLTTEMGGTLTATPFAELDSAIIAKDRFCQSHGLEHQPSEPSGGYAGHACCNIEKFTLAPRLASHSSNVDSRFAVMSYLFDTIETSIVNTVAEVRAEVKRIKDLLGDEAWTGCHAILIPQPVAPEHLPSHPGAHVFH